MNWTQPICLSCWLIRNPDRVPVRITDQYAIEEKCCDCGSPTKEGIYFRVDPRTVRFPK